MKGQPELRKDDERIDNVFARLRTSEASEQFLELLSRPNLRIERIVSTGHASPDGFWYDQAEGEWVVVLSGEARLAFKDEAKPRLLHSGDFVDIAPLAVTASSGLTPKCRRSGLPCTTLERYFTGTLKPVTPSHMKLARVLLPLAATICLCAAADTHRSFKAEVFFRLANPCPSTGETHGTCTGYVIDRIIPVVCGGAEDPDNMQWQTTAEARAKDRWERIGCRAGRKLVVPGPPAFAEAFPLEEASPAPAEVAPLPLQ